jgi:hypothetical protein
MDVSIVKKTHCFSGLFLAIFVAIHLVNHLFSLFSPSEHIELMNRLRVIYRQPVVESVLLFAVIFQMLTGIKMVFNKDKESIAQRVQQYSGLYIALFLVIHVGAVMFGRYLQLDTNFYFAAAGINSYPAKLFFIPYYFLAVMAVGLHLASLVYIKYNSRPMAASLVVISAVIATLIIIGFSVSPLPTIVSNNGGFTGASFYLLNCVQHTAIRP